MRLMILAALLLAGCANPSTERAKDDAAREVTDRQVAEREITEAIRSWNEQRTEAVIAGDDVKVEQIDSEIERLRAEADLARARTAESRSRYEEITMREREERSQSAGMWFNLALGLFGAATGTAALGAIPAARREAA